MLPDMADNDETVTPGVSMSQSLHDRALRDMDGHNKSRRFRSLIRLGLATEQAFENADLPDATDMHEREVLDTLRTALDEAEF
jgi:hypothetical protein